MSNTTNEKLPSYFSRGWIRWRGLFIVLLFSGILGLYFSCLLDWHLRYVLESAATRANRGPVSIGKLELSLLQGELHLENIEVGSPWNPGTNLLTLDKINVHFELAPLLSKKLVIQDVSVEGVGFYTERKSAVPAFGDDQTAMPGLMERVANGFYEELKQDIGDNPLNTLGKLLTGMNLSDRVGSNARNLSSLNRVRDWKTRVETTQMEWQERFRSLPDLKTYPKLAEASQRPDLLAQFQKDETAIESLLNEVRSKTHQFTKELRDTEKLIDEDVNQLRSRMQLPRLDLDDLTPVLMGPTYVNFLERITYWVDLSRRKMPKGSRTGQITRVELTSRDGIDVHFGKMSTFPTFLLREGRVLSTEKKDGQQGNVQGKINGLTTDPPIFSQPLTMELSANFPHNKISGMRIGAEVDHTGAQDKESFRFVLESIPVSRWAINETGDVLLRMDKGVARLSAEMRFTDNEIQGAFQLAASDAEFHVNSPFKRLEETVQHIVSGTRNFEMEATIGGTSDRLKFQARSQLGRNLAQGLKQEFRHQIGAIDDTLRRYILDEFHPVKEAGLLRLHETETRIAPALEARVKYIQELRQNTERSVASIKQPKN